MNSYVGPCRVGLVCNVQNILGYFNLNEYSKYSLIYFYIQVFKSTYLLLLFLLFFFK